MMEFDVKVFCFFFFFNDTATTEIYTLSLHDALPISAAATVRRVFTGSLPRETAARPPTAPRSEEHTSELQSPYDIVCRLLLEKKKKLIYIAVFYKKKTKNKT